MANSAGIYGATVDRRVRELQLSPWMTSLRRVHVQRESPEGRLKGVGEIRRQEQV
jgi:hypothetical protein